MQIEEKQIVINGQNITLRSPEKQDAKSFSEVRDITYHIWCCVDNRLFSFLSRSETAAENLLFKNIDFPLINLFPK